MTPTETVQLLAVVASVCPAMRMEETTPDVWHAVLGHLNAADAREAVIRLARTSRWIAPADVIAEVKAIRADRIERANRTEPPSVDPDRAAAYSRELLARVIDIASRKDITRALDAPVRRGCPPELRDDTAKVRIAALDVACPHCGAVVGEWCHVPNTDRRPDGGLHESRVKALGERGTA